MKRKISLFRICAAVVILLATVLLVAGGALADPLKVRVTFEKAIFNLDDPNEKITAYITFENISGSDVWTREGFSELRYHFYLYFKGPGADGPLITFTSQTSGSPAPGVETPFVNVERLASGWLINMPIDEVRDNYPLAQPGQYKVWFAMPFVQYDSNQLQPALDDDGNPIPDKFVAPTGATIWTDPIEFKETYITLTTGVVADKSDVRIMATEYIFGEGSHPGVTKKPLTDIEVRLYKLSDIAAEGISPINHQVYVSIATNDNIPSDLAVPAVPGEYIFESVPQDPEGYLVLGHAKHATDYKHLGRTIAGDDLNWGEYEIFKKLILMTNKGGKKSPGKSKKLTGSELFIIEPEYVEWSTSEELYPFAFESVGDWGVEVAVAPPEGFVADQPILSESVTSELEGLQFTITDEGSTWKPTKVNYQVKHKKKTQTISSQIGVKLTRQLAEEKGVGEWGEADREASQEEHEEEQEEHEDDQEKKQDKKSK